MLKKNELMNSKELEPVVDWIKVVKIAKSLKYKDRRKFYKKIKRKARRRSSAGLQSPTLQSLNNGSNENEFDTYTQLDYFAVGPFMSDVQTILNTERLKQKESSPNGASTDDQTTEQVSTCANTSLNDGNTSLEDEQEHLLTSGEINTEDKDKNKDQELKDNEIATFLDSLDAEVQEWHNPYLKEKDLLPSQNLSQQPIISTQTPQALLQFESTEMNQSQNIETKKERCFFYDTTGSCKYGDMCERRHKAATKSATILIPGMFKTFALDMVNRVKRGGGTHGDVHDLGLEYGDDDMYDNFLEFSKDVLKELRKYGRVVQFKVCCNRSRHLQGNIYVEYDRKREAKMAFEKLDNRFYDGKLLQCKLVKIRSWKKAICGMHYRRGNCSHGDLCNFLHVFKDKSREFYWADQDRY